MTLARFGLTTGFLLSPADDRRCRLVFSLRGRFSQWVTCAVNNVQGALGEGTLGYKVMLITYRVCLEKDTLVSWFGVWLVMVTKMDVFLCFQADILLEIPRGSK